MCPPLDAADVPLERDASLPSVLGDPAGLREMVVSVEDGPGTEDADVRRTAPLKQQGST